VASAYDWLPLGAMRMFEAVPSHLSFAVATQAANVTHATVSQQIKTLEAYAQAPLFRRTGRRVEITAEGLELLLSERSELGRLSRKRI
jgi:DNA-binding transcriptional LysR family regulator